MPDIELDPNRVLPFVPTWNVAYDEHGFLSSLDLFDDAEAASLRDRWVNRTRPAGEQPERMAQLFGEFDGTAV